MAETVIEASGLTRAFGARVAVDGLNLRVERQQFLGFLGPNGAGKSTTIKMLTGLLSPSAGRIRVLGLDVRTQGLEVKRRIGVVPEGLALFERLTGTQLLNFVGRMYGLDRVTAGERAAGLLEFMELGDAADEIVADYSHGMKKKIALAAAVIHRPEILFLDEPFEAVDALAARTLKMMLERFIERGGTVFLTSHVLEVVERLCSYIAIIRHGRLVAEGSIEELRKGVRLAEDQRAGDGTDLTLEQIFLRVLGGARSDSSSLGWL